MSDEPNRRRHHRAPAPLDVTVAIAGADVPVTRVIDASIGGVLVELAPASEPPRLSAHGRATLRRGADVVERGARVVRIRWTGRQGGVLLPPAVALVFDDADDEAALRLEGLLR